jgi:hypothetical protein
VIRPSRSWQLFPAPAGLAPEAFPSEDRLPVADETPARPRNIPVAAAADPGDGRQAAAGTEQRAQPQSKRLESHRLGSRVIRLCRWPKCNYLKVFVAAASFARLVRSKMVTREPSKRF